MATIPNHVQPGDLITSADFNNIIDELNDLESRLKLLEGTGTSASNNVAITSLAPEGDLRVGQELTIFGHNFGFSVGAHRVFFNSSRATVFKTGSNDSKLIIDIPDVPGVTEAGTPPATLTVANFASSDSRQVTLRPVQLGQQGTISLTFQGVTPTTITAGSTPIFAYRLESQALRPATVTIAPASSITGLQVLGPTGTPLQNNQITLAPSQITQISVQTGPIPAGVTSFNLSVNASASGLTPSGDTRTFPVGTPIEPPDPGVTTFDFENANPPTAFSNDILTVAAGSTATIQLRAEFSAAELRTYDVLQPVLVGTATGWTAVRSTSPFFSTPASYSISAGLGMTQFPAFDVSAQPGATSTATVEFILKRQDSTSKVSKTFTLQRS